MVRNFPRLSLRALVGVTGLSAGVGAIPARAQGTQPEVPPSAPTTLIRPKNPFLQALNQRPPIRVTTDLPDSTREFAVRELARLAGVRISLPENEPRLSERVHFSVANTPVLEAMGMALRGTGLQATFADEQGSIVSIHPATGPAPVSTLLEIVEYEDQPVLTSIAIDTVRPRRRILSFPDSSKTTAAMLAGVVTTATGLQRQHEIGTRIISLNVDSIMRIAPILSVTDLIDGRVPGLSTQRTSGSPGDPSRIRVRGLGSIAQYNDPIIVVDGARMYSRQSDKRNLNAGGFINYAGERTSQYATPSPLDQIEPGTIERIEVLKGPSASALYGSDAANGVIVITTKRGRSGPTRWILSAEQGLSYMPGVSYDAQHTPFSQGSNNGLMLTLSGGNPAIQYAYSAAKRTQVGVLKLPEIEQQRYFQKNGTAAPGWMRQPDHLDGIGGNGQVTIQVNKRVDLALTNLMNSSTQKRSSMSNGLNGVLGDLERQLALESGDSSVLSNYYERVTSQHRNFLLSLQVRYRPVESVPINATFGLGRLMREDKNMVARSVFQSPDSTGFYGSGDGTAIERTVAVSSVVPLLDIFSIGVGVNAQHGTVSDLRGSFRNIPLGVTVPSNGDVIEFSAPENSWRLFGWFVEPKIMVTPRLFVTPGVRIDNTALSGAPAQWSTFPKLSVSWVASDEPSFSSWAVGKMFSALRFRTAIGYAGVPPTASDQLEQQRQRSINAASRVDPWLIWYPAARFERSMEMEGGFDAEMWRGRVRMDMTYYRKTRKDAIINNPLASSLPDIANTSRYGEIRYSGTELGMDAQLIERDGFRWQGGMTVSRNSSELVSVTNGLNTSVVVGEEPTVASFPREARNPNYQMAFNSGMTFFNGRIGIFTSFTYISGMIQRNLAGTPIFTDTTTTENILYGSAETVNAFRWQTLSVNYEAPSVFARLIRVASMNVALQGANLGLLSNYSGLDPNVSSLVTGNATFDAGQIPQPRSWQLRVTLRR